MEVKHEITSIVNNNQWMGINYAVIRLRYNKLYKIQI